MAIKEGPRGNCEETVSEREKKYDQRDRPEKKNVAQVRTTKWKKKGFLWVEKRSLHFSKENLCCLWAGAWGEGTPKGGKQQSGRYKTGKDAGESLRGRGRENEFRSTVRRRPTEKKPQLIFEGEFNEKVAESQPGKKISQSRKVASKKITGVGKKKAPVCRDHWAGEKSE